MDRFAKAVVVTGGSSGIGGAFITQLGLIGADRGFCNLSRKKPSSLPENIRLKSISVNLAAPEVGETALDQLRGFLEDHPVPTLLVNNAGFGTYGDFPAEGVERELEMLRLNAGAPLLLTSVLLEHQKRYGGAIINVASNAAFQSMPYFATYGATKAFLVNWTLALRRELAPSGIRVQALCPGPTKTGFFQAAGFTPDDNKGSAVPFSHAPEFVVQASLRGLMHNQAIVIPGLRNRLIATAASLFPRTWVAFFAGVVMKQLRLERFQ